MKRIGLLLAAAIFIFTGCSTPLTEREAKLPARKTIVYGSDLTVSRALAAKMTALFLKNGTLSSPVIQTAAYQDVGKEDWFFPYVQIVSQAGLMQDESGAFRPNDPLTVGQAMTLLEQLGYESKQAGNKDDPISLALWQEWFLAAAQQAGLPTQETEFSVFATASLGGLSPWQAASSAGLICHEGFVLDPYVDCALGWSSSGFAGPNSSLWLLSWGMGDPREWTDRDLLYRSQPDFPWAFGRNRCS